MAKNVLGEELISCSENPTTGFFRNGKCDTNQEDQGMHTVCALMTDSFLAFSKEHGNDLSTPREEYGFPGLKAGNFWCLCLSRWIQAYQNGVAPRVRVKATHISVLEFIELKHLKEYDADDRES
jgi:uncharacterized protein (DUF2237 family)